MPPSTTPPQTIPFDQLPDSSGMAMYKDKLIVYDNLSVPLSQTYSEQVSAMLSNLPLKIEFTVVLFCLEGGAEISCSLRNYHIGPGEIMIFVPGTIGESVKIIDESKMIVMSFSDDSFSPIGSLKNSLYSQANFNHPIKFEVDSDMIWPTVQEYQHLKHALMYSKFLNDELVKAYISVLTSYAVISMQKWAQKGTVKNEGSVPSDKLFNKFMDLLGKHYIEHKDVAFYAQECKLSAKYFSKQIFSISGKHPMDWIKAHVVLNAQAMLKSGDYSVAQVSEALHFSSQSAFNRYFKDQTGMSPKEYLK